MKLLTAHKILIGSATVFFAMFALSRLGAYGSGGDVGVLLSGIAGLAASVGLAAYYRTIGSE